MMFGMCVYAKSFQSCLILCDPIDFSLPGSSISVGFSRQEYWSGLPFPPPGDLLNPGIKSSFSVSPSLQVDSLPLSYLESMMFGRLGVFSTFLTYDIFSL